MGYALTTKFEAPPDTHTVLVVTAHYWGRGKDKAAAMAQVKKQGGRPCQHGYWAYYFGAGFQADTGWVDQMGFVNWEWTEQMAERPRTERPNPVLEEVGTK